MLSLLQQKQSWCNFSCHFVLLLLACGTFNGASGQPQWLGVKYVTEMDSEAVCNDGTAAGYYILQPPQPSAVWVLYLEGGLWCYDEASCLQRYEDGRWAMSSANWPVELSATGIFDSSPQNPFNNANLVYAAYCSSDAWFGDVGASAATFGFAFRGAHILDAILADLVINHGMGASPGERLLFSGCSAGARGAMANADRLPAVLASLGIAMRVQALLDSPLWIAIATAPGSSGVVPLESETQSVLALVQPPADVIGAECAQLYAGEEWKCLFGQYRVPLITTPFLLQESQFDSFQLTYNENSIPPYTGAALTYANSFQQAMLAVLGELPTAAQQQAGSAIYSRSCWEHCTSDKPLFWGGTAAVGEGQPPRASGSSGGAWSQQAGATQWAASVADAKGSAAWLAGSAAWRASQQASTSSLQAAQASGAEAEQASGAEAAAPLEKGTPAWVAGSAAWRASQPPGSPQAAPAAGGWQGIVTDVKGTPAWLAGSAAWRASQASSTAASPPQPQPQPRQAGGRKPGGGRGLLQETFHNMVLQVYGEAAVAAAAEQAVTAAPTTTVVNAAPVQAQPAVATAAVKGQKQPRQVAAAVAGAQPQAALTQSQSATQSHAAAQTIVATKRHHKKPVAAAAPPPPYPAEPAQPARQEAGVQQQAAAAATSAAAQQTKKEQAPPRQTSNSSTSDNELQAPTSFAAMPDLSVVLGAWFFNGDSTSYVEQCTGFQCSAQCPMIVDADAVTAQRQPGWLLQDTPPVAALPLPRRVLLLSV